MIVKGQILGFKELDKLLTQLPPNVEKRVLQGAVTSAMREAARGIRQAAPVSEDRSPASKKYGRLSRNIRVVRLRRVRRGEKGAQVNTGNAFWGMFIEFGTRYQDAHPWFAPAFRKAYEKVLQALSKGVEDGIVKEALKLRGKQ